MSNRSKTPAIERRDALVLHKSLSTSALQRKFNKPHPSREYCRFLRERISASGLDQSGGFSEFMNRDLIKPYHDKSVYQFPFSSQRNQWALETKKQCSDQSMLPKVQQFKQYHFPHRDAVSIDKYRSTFLGTDNIAIRVPQIDKVEQNNSFLNKKAQYGPHTESIQSSELHQNKGKTLSNKSSVGYNILSQEINQNETKANILDNRINFKRRGIGAFCDQTKVFCTNFNKDFQAKLNNDDHLFHIYKGIFSNMYDIAHRNGNIIVPFRKGGNN